MKIIMTRSAPGSVDGIRVANYEVGTEYDLTATAGERDLAAAFVGAGMAEEVGAPVAPVTIAPVITIDTRVSQVDIVEAVATAVATTKPGKPGRSGKK